MRMRSWCWVLLGIVSAVMGLLGLSEDAPLHVIIFCCVMLAVSTGLMAFLLLTSKKEKEEIAPLPAAVAPQPPISVAVQVAPSINIENREEAVRRKILNEVRSSLWEKELRIAHLVEENQRTRLFLEEKTGQLLEMQERLENHPIELDYRQLRKQFEEKAEALHRMRQQMFAIEGELLVLQRQQEEMEEDKIEEIAQLMLILGEAERENDRQEEHIQLLEEQVQAAPKKRAVRKKKTEVQEELFTLPKVPRPRKKRTPAPAPIAS